MRARVRSVARVQRPRGERVASIVFLCVLGVALHLTETQTLRAVAAAGFPRDGQGDPPAPRARESFSPADYMAVAELRSRRPALVGVALARMSGDAQEIVVGVCGLEPDHPYRLVIDGLPAATLIPSENGVVNASLSSVPDAAEQLLPERARPVSKVKRVELVEGGGVPVASGNLRAVRARACKLPPRSAEATALGPPATTTP